VDDDKVFIYYASSDTRMHVATTTIGRLLDYAVNTPADGFTSAKSVDTIVELIKRNAGHISHKNKTPRHQNN
jgi:4-O-beta-D-mannosyl-D-glucose phosphorylase